MVAIVVSPPSSAPDAAASARSSSGKGNGDGSSGFQDVLDSSGSGRDTRKAPAGSSATAQSDTAGTSGSAQRGASPLSAQTSDPANKGQNQTVPGASGPAQPSVTVPDDMIAPDATTPATDPGTLSAADIAQQLAAMVAGDGSTGQTVADGKTGAPTSKGDKTTTAADAGSDGEDKAADADTANGAVADVLTLLGGAVPAAVVPAQVAPSVLAAAGQLHGGNGKTVSGADGGVGTVSVAAGDPADGQPTAAQTGMAMLASASAKIGNTDSDADNRGSDDATQSFSLARVSAKSQLQELAAGKSADDAQQLDLKATAGDGVGTVTVLESRRFVGLADGSNSALVANALTGNKDWAAAMQPSAALTGASATTSVSKVMNSLKIQMNPENLGVVTANMRLSGDQLSVDLKVHSAEAYRQLSNDQTAMVDSLRQQGYAVDRVTVTYTSPDTSSNNNQPGAQGQQQQSGASQGQGSDAQARKQNSGRQAGDQDGVWGTAAVAADDVASGNSQRVRAGGVYL